MKGGKLYFALSVFVALEMVSPSLGQFLSPAEEPAITMFPFGGGQRATVFANGNQFATYDLVNGSFQLVASGAAPNPAGHTVISDPVAVTQPNGTVYIGALAWRGDFEGVVYVWKSTNGVSWSNPITVVEYFQELPMNRSWADKPWIVSNWGRTNTTP